MRKLRELTTRVSLAELLDVLEAQIVDGETAPPVRPEGEKEFVKLHKVEKHTDPDRLRNPSFSGKVKKDTSAAGKEPKPGFPPNTGQKDYPANEENELDEGLFSKKKEPSIDRSIYNKKGIKIGFHDYETAKKKAEAGEKWRYKEEKKPKDVKEETEPSWYIDEYGRPRRVDEAHPAWSNKSRHPSMRKPAAPIGSKKEPTRRGFVRKGALEYHPLGDTTEKQYRKSGEAYKEETEIDEAAGIFRARVKKEHPLIKRPKFDSRGNVILTKAAKENITVGKKSRKLSGKEYKPSEQKKFGEEKEQIDEAGYKVKKTSSEVSRGNPDDWEPDITTRHYDVYHGKAKVGNLRDNDYFGGLHGKLHNKDLPWDISGYKKLPSGKEAKNHAETLAAFVQSKTGTKWRKNIWKYSPSRKGKKWGLKDSGIKNEETEQLDELSRKTLTDFIKVGSTRAIGNAYLGAKLTGQGAIKSGRELTGKAAKHALYVGKAAERLGGTFEVGKPVSVMIPGKGDNDPASGPYKMKRKKIYHMKEDQLDEKAVSKAQQRFMGMAYAIRKGESDRGSEAVTKAAADMSMKELRKFAKTKHKGLPEKVKEETEIDEGKKYKTIYDPNKDKKNWAMSSSGKPIYLPGVDIKKKKKGSK